MGRKKIIKKKNNNKIHSQTGLETNYTLEADVRGSSTYYCTTVFVRKLVVPISACLFSVIASFLY